jgi:hypothetical protein
MIVVANPRHERAIYHDHGKRRYPGRSRSRVGPYCGSLVTRVTGRTTTECTNVPMGGLECAHRYIHPRRHRQRAPRWPHEPRPQTPPPPPLGLPPALPRPATCRTCSLPHPQPAAPAACRIRGPAASPDPMASRSRLRTPAASRSQPRDPRFPTPQPRARSVASRSGLRVPRPGRWPVRDIALMRWNACRALHAEPRMATWRGCAGSRIDAR